jgi:hypothetical protein
MLKAFLITEEEVAAAFLGGTRLTASKIINEGYKRIVYIGKNHPISDDVINTLKGISSTNTVYEDIISDTNKALALIESASEGNPLKEKQIIDILDSLEKANKRFEKYKNKENLNNLELITGGITQLTGLEAGETVTAEEVNNEVKDTIIPETEKGEIVSEDIDTTRRETPKKSDPITAGGSFFDYNYGEITRDNTGEAQRHSSAESKSYQTFINSHAAYTDKDVTDGKLVFEVELLPYTQSKTVVTEQNKLTLENWEALGKALNITALKAKELGEQQVLLKLNKEGKQVGVTYLHEVHYVNPTNMGLIGLVTKTKSLDEVIFEKRLELLKYRKSVIEMTQHGNTVIEIPVTNVSTGHINSRKNNKGEILYSPLTEVMKKPFAEIDLAVAEAGTNLLIVRGVKTTLTGVPGYTYMLVDGPAGRKVPVQLKTKVIKKDSIEANSIQIAAWLLLTGNYKEAVNGAKYNKRTLETVIANLVGNKRIEINPDTNKAIVTYIEKNNTSNEMEVKRMEFNPEEVIDGKLNDFLEQQKITQTISYRKLANTSKTGDQTVPFDIKLWDAEKSDFVEQKYTDYNEYLEKNQLLQSGLSKTQYKVVQPNVSLGEPRVKTEVGKITFESLNNEPVPFLDDVNNEEKEDDSENFIEPPFRLSPITNTAVDNSYKKEDIEKARTWFNERFGANIKLETFNKLYRIGDSNVHGYFERALDKLGGTVVLWDNAEEGTLYHEAFHAVFRTFLTNEERTALLKERPEFSGMTNLQIEEKLAEEFREYVLNDGEVKLPKETKNFFEELLDLLKTFWDVVTGVKKTNLTINELFKRIDKGYYKNAIPVTETMEYFAPKAFSAKESLTPKQLEDILDTLDFKLHDFIFGKTTGISTSFLELINSKDSGAKLNSFYNDFFNNVEKVIPNFKDKPVLQKRLIKLLNNKAEIVASHGKHLGKYGITFDVDTDEIITEGNFLNITESIEINLKDKVREEIKFFISIVPKLDRKTGKILLNSYGFPKKASWESTYKLLQKKMANTTSFDESITRLESIAKHRPEIRYVLDNLKSKPLGFQISFVQTFTQQKNNYLLTLINSNTDQIYKKNPETTTAEKNVVDEWFNNFKSSELVIEGELGEKEFDVKKLREITDKFIAINAKYRHKIPFNTIISLGEEVGIIFSEETLAYLDAEQKADISANIYHVLNTLGKTREPELSYTEWNKNLMALAAYEADNRGDLQIDSHLNPEGKSVFGYSLTTPLNDIVNKFNNGDLQGLENKVNTKHSLYLDQIKQGKEITLYITEGINNDESGKEGTVFKDMGYGDYLTVRFNNILDTVFNNPDNPKGIFASFQAGDKSTAFSIGGFDLVLNVNEINNLFAPELVDTDEDSMMAEYSSQKSKKDTKNKIAKIFYGYFLDEMNRIVLTRAQLGLIKEDSNEAAFLRKTLGNETASTLLANVLPESERIVPYHQDAKGDILKGTGLKFSIFTDILPKDIKEYIEKGNYVLTPEQTNKIKNSFLNYIDKETTRNYNALIKNKVLVQTKDGIKNNALNAKTLEQYDNNFKALTYHATLNDLISKIEFTKLFVGDLAFYNDLFKRMQQFQSTGRVCMSGETVNTHIQQEIYNKSPNTKGKIATNNARIVVINDLFRTESNDEGIAGLLPLLDSIFISAGFKPEAIASIKEAYGNTNSTDGSTWSTLEAFKEFHERIGDWDKALQEPIYQKVINNESITPEDYLNLITLKPYKPVIVGKEASESRLNMPFYGKTAVAPPLIPQFVRNTELEKMLNVMYRDKIDYITVISSSKVASKGYVNNAWKEDGSFNDDIQYTNHVSLIPWNGFRENLEIDANKKQETVLEGSQIRKLIWTGTAEQGKFKDTIINVGNKQMSLEHAWKAYNKAHGLIAKRAAEKLEKTFGIQIIDGKFKITNLEGVIELLKEEIDDLPQNSAEQLAVIENPDGTKQLKLPFDVTTLGNKIQQKLNNLITQRVVKNKRKGSANIMMSNAGHYSVDNGGIIRGDIKSYIDKNGLTLEIKLPHHFKKLFGSNVDINDIDPKLLQMIGYRIPTQGLNSIHKLKVVGFLPKELGDVIMLPSVITVIEGSDFDIDKMYLYKYNHAESVQDLILKDNINIRENLLNAIASGSYLDYQEEKLVKAEGLKKEFIERRINFLKANVQKVLEIYDNLTEEELIAIRASTYVKERLKETKKGEYTEREILQNIYPDESDFLLMAVIKDAIGKYAGEIEQTKLENNPSLIQPISSDFNSLDELDSFNNKRLENVMMDIELGLLSNPDNLALQLVPNDASNLKKIRDEINKNKLTEEEFKALYNVNTVTGEYKKKGLSYTQYIQLMDNADAFINFVSGKAGVGQVAVHNTHHVLAQIANFKIAKDSFSYIGLPVNRDSEGNVSLAHNKDSNNDSFISESISQLLTAFVDIAKDPFIFDLNANSFTTNSILLMVRAGVPLDYVFNFMQQPIINDYIQETIINESQIVEKTRNNFNEEKPNLFKSKENIIKGLIAKYSALSDSIIDNHVTSGKTHSVENLKVAQRIGTGKTKPENDSVLDKYVAIQLDCLNYFLRVQDLSKKLQGVITSGNIDSKGIPKEMWLVENKIENILNFFNDPAFINTKNILDIDYAVEGITTKENPTSLDHYVKYALMNSVNWFTDEILLQQNHTFKRVFKEMLKKENILEEDENGFTPARYTINKESIARKIRQHLFFSAVAYTSDYSVDLISGLFEAKYDVPSDNITYGFNLKQLVNHTKTGSNAIVTGVKYTGKYNINGKYVVDLDQPSTYSDIDALDENYPIPAANLKGERKKGDGKKQFLKDFGFDSEASFVKSKNAFVINFYNGFVTDSTTGEKVPFDKSLTVSKVKSFNQGALKSNSLATLLSAIKRDKSNKLNSNLLISLLSPDIANKAGNPDLIKFSSSVNDVELKDNITKAWEELLQDNEPINLPYLETPVTPATIGKLLTIYSLYQSGLNDNPYSLFRYIPSNSYLEEINTLVNGKEWFDNFFEDNANWVEEEIMSNMYKDDTLIRSIPARKTIDIEYIDSEGFTYNNAGFIAKADQDFANNKYVKIKKPRYTTKGGKKSVYLYKLYKNVGKNLSGDSVFVRIPIKGETNKLFEMGLNVDDSIIKDNKIVSEKTVERLPKEYRAYVESKLASTTDSLEKEESDDKDYSTMPEEPVVLSSIKDNNNNNELVVNGLTQEEFDSLTEAEKQEVIRQSKEC